MIYSDCGGGGSPLIVTCNGHIVVAGDHIYTWRKGFLYSHHGIYVGRNLVVHFFNPDWNSSSSSSSTISSSSSSTNSSSSSSNTNSRRTCSNPGCEIGKDNNGVAIYCLDCFLENGSLYRYDYPCESDPADIVINRAMHFLRHGFGRYSLKYNNCEDFALKCKVGNEPHQLVMGKLKSQVSPITIKGLFIQLFT